MWKKNSENTRAEKRPAGCFWSSKTQNLQQDFFWGPVRLRSIEISLGFDVVSFAWSFFNSFCQKLQKTEDEPKNKKTEAHIWAFKRKTKIPIPKSFPPPKKKNTHQLYQRTRPRLVTPQKNSSGLEMKGPGHPTPMGTIPQVQRSLYDSQVPRTVGFWWQEPKGSASAPNKNGPALGNLWLFFSFNFATFWEFSAAKKNRFSLMLVSLIFFGQATAGIGFGLLKQKSINSLG